jgi:hypothetical protein
MLNRRADSLLMRVITPVHQNKTMEEVGLEEQD